jgi:transketolase
MIGAAIGLSQNGYIPVCYSITPFVIYRPFEFLRNYLNNEGQNVKLVGSGRDRDYGHCGFTHWAEDDVKILGTLPNIKVFKPKELEQKVFDSFLSMNGPAYLNLAR